MKAKVYIFLVIYVLSCVGIIIDFHYCGGRLETIALFHIDGDDCCGKEEEKTCNCCEDRLVFVDTDDTDNVKSTNVRKSPVKKLICQYHNSTILLFYDCFINKAIVPINHAPPDWPSNPLFIKNRILLI